MGNFAHPAGDALALVKLKGHDWVYVADGREVNNDQPMKAWSKALASPVLYAGEESVSSVVFYQLWQSGKCVESFESDGELFRGGVEIDPDVNEEEDRMLGTDFRSTLRAADQIDWSSYSSEWEFLERFLRQQN